MEIDMSRKLKPVSPGEILAAEYLKPLGMSNYRLAKEIGVPAQRIGEILAGGRAITADTDLRLPSLLRALRRMVAASAGGL
jgi:addiction module HigA family antidote